MKPLTARQQQVYEFICTSVKDKGFPPTRIEIAEAMGITPNAAHCQCVLLEKKGFIEIAAGMSRGIKLTRAKWETMVDRLDTYWSLMREDLEALEPSEALQFIEALHELQKNWVAEKLGL